MTANTMMMHPIEHRIICAFEFSVPSHVHGVNVIFVFIEILKKQLGLQTNAIVFEPRDN